MKLKTSTIALVAVAAILGGAVYLSQANNTSSGNPTGQAIVEFEEQDVAAFTLKTQLRSLEFAKDDSGTWQMKQPDAVPANEAAIAYLLNLVVVSEGDRAFTAPVDQQEEFGFHQPMATLDLTLSNQESHQVIIGGYNFDRSRLYAQIDPPAEPTDTLNIVLLPAEFDGAVNRALPEWKDTAPEEPSEESPEESPEENPAE